MKAPFTLLAVAIAASASFALQENWPKPSYTSIQYANYRGTGTEPAYGLTKVKALVKKIAEDSDGNRRMPDKSYNALSVEEKFTYIMIHGEDFSQNCDAMPPIIDEHKKIFPYFPSPFGDEAAWSERQTKFMLANRTKMISLIRETMKSKHRAGPNLKQAVVLLNANELIPDFISLYKRDRKDHDILSLFMLQMRENKYPPFLANPLNRKLYGDDANYQSFVQFNSANEKLILDLTNGFYKSRTTR